MRALSIRQPWAELILSGIKRVEYRSRPTLIIGERFLIYASKGKVQPGSELPSGTRTTRATESSSPVRRSDNLELLAAVVPPGWMIELAEMLKLFPESLSASLPTGVIVGSAVIEKVVAIQPLVVSRSNASAGSASSQHWYEWHLGGVERAKSYRKPSGRPQPVWFWPF